MSSPPGLVPHLPDETTSNQTPAAALGFADFSGEFDDFDAVTPSPL